MKDGETIKTNKIKSLKSKRPDAGDKSGIAGGMAIGCLIEIAMLVCLGLAMGEDTASDACAYALIFALPALFIHILAYRCQRRWGKLDVWVNRLLGPLLFALVMLLAVYYPFDVGDQSAGKSPPAERQSAAALPDRQDDKTPAAREAPPRSGLVNDLAGRLSPAAVQTLELNLKQLEREDSTSIAVLVIDSLEGAVLEDFSLKVAEAWGLGEAGKDNGALLLVALKDRAVRIEVGYGLEDRLTDLVCGRIIRHEITPAFREGDFDQGVLNGVAAMTAAVKGAYQADDADAGRDFEGDDVYLLGFFGWIAGHFAHLTRRRRALWAAALGGTGGLLAGQLFSVAAPLALFALIGAVGGWLALFVTWADVMVGGGGGGGGSGSRGGGGGFGGGGASGRW